MRNIFAIGCNDPGFRTIEGISGLPGFQGIINTGPIVQSAFWSSSVQESIAAMKIFSFNDFVNFARKNPGTILVSFFGFSGGRRYIESLKKLSRYKLEIYDFYNFYLENNIKIGCTFPQQEREEILNSRQEWQRFRTQLTDNFSRETLDAYLKALETKDTASLMSVYVDTKLQFINRYSRRLSLVPHSSETYIDVGALDGDTVTQFVDCAKTYKSIHAFEPSPEPFKLLKARQSYLDNFHVYSQVVSDKTGEIKFFADSTPGARVAGPEVDDDAPSLQVVSCVRLDDVIEEATMIKIEVEGHEPQVIAGAKKLIQKCKPDICAYAYHYPLDPIRILDQTNDAHHYKYIALRSHAVDPYKLFVYFSDRAPFE